MRRRECQRARIARSSKQLYSQLTSYERWPEWLPAVRAARLLAGEGGVAIVEVVLVAEGVGDTGSRRVFEVVESPPDQITFHQVDVVGRVYSGRCQLLASKAEETELEVSLSVAAPALAWGLRSGLREALEGLFEALKQPAPPLGRVEEQLAESPATLSDRSTAQAEERCVLRLSEGVGGELRLDLEGTAWRYRAGRGWRRC